MLYEKTERLKMFAEGVKVLFMAYNKPITDKTLLLKAESMQEIIRDIPDEKLRDFFKAASRTFGTMPSEAQIMGFYATSPLRVGKMGVDADNAKYGYYDDNGAWIRNGAFFTFLYARPKQLSKREREVKAIWFKHDCRMPEELKEEFDGYMATKYWIPKGKIQKPRHEWTKLDHDILEKSVEIKQEKEQEEMF